MSIAPEVTRIRQLFESGQFEQGLELIRELALSNEVMASRLYLLYRPQIYFSISAWASKVLSSTSVFLPADLFDHDAPYCFDAVRGFEADYAATIREEEKAHHEHFGSPGVDVTRIEKGIAAWAEERELRK